MGDTRIIDAAIAHVEKISESHQKNAYESSAAGEIRAAHVLVHGLADLALAALRALRERVHEES